MPIFSIHRNIFYIDIVHNCNEIQCISTVNATFHMFSETHMYSFISYRCIDDYFKTTYFFTTYLF